MAFLAPNPLPLNLQLRPSVATCSARPPRRSNVATCMSSELVTFGDIWRNAVDDDLDIIQVKIENQVSRTHNGVSITGTSAGMGPTTLAMAALADSEAGAVSSARLPPGLQPVVKVAQSAASVAASAAATIWGSLTKGPTEAEVEENMRLFSLLHGGAVARPMVEEELSSEVRFVGLFPDLVSSMVDSDCELDELPTAA